ncbi:MAG: Gfo/Idh/MocA family oxidoreductase [Anaerolineales bacterium]|nr:Gfo/Idh/MocA family oxidoreductase [Anaerolineales bacterium]
MRKLRLGFVGCGDISGYMAWFARLNRGVELAACCDIDPRIAQAFASRRRIAAAFTDLGEMLAGAALEAVYLATPHNLHLPMARQAVEAGLAVFCEKPLEASPQAGRQMVELARASGAKIAINYQYRYDAAAYAIARAAQSGDLGELLYLRANIPWRRQADYFRVSGGWHSSKARAGGGTLLTQGSHFLDLMLWMASSRPIAALGYSARRRFKEIEVEDLAMGIVELESGCALEICSSMVANPQRRATLEVYGSQGSAIYHEGDLPRLEWRGVRPPRRRPPVRGLHALGRSLEAFCQWVIDDKPTLNPVEEAYRTLLTVDAIYRSAASGKREAIPG